MDAADVARTTGPANRAQCNGNNWHPQSKCHKRPCESPEFFSVPVTSSPSLSVCWVNHRPTSRRAGGSRASLTLLGPDPCIRMRNQRKGPVTCRPTGSVAQRDPRGRRSGGRCRQNFQRLEPRVHRRRSRAAPPGVERLAAWQAFLLRPSSFSRTASTYD